ncbi:MAG: hypothetical protein RLZZ295_891, partial [Actinomycetota bacterium]
MLSLRKLRAIAITGALAASLLSTAPAQALTFKQIPATNWGYIYAGTEATTAGKTSAPTKNLETKSKFEVKYNN